MVENRSSSQPDVIFVGAGIMSATLALVLKQLEPAPNIEIFETLAGAAEESSDAWNKAGTGHAALCELKTRRMGRQAEGAIPSYGESLIDNAELCRRVRADTASVLHLDNV